MRRCGRRPFFVVYSAEKGDIMRTRVLPGRRQPMLSRIFLTTVIAVPFLAVQFQGLQEKPVQNRPRDTDRTHTGVVVCVVKDDAGSAGRPVAAAEVSIMDSVTKETDTRTTDKDGKCRWAQLYPGEYVLKAKKGELESDPVTVKVSNEQSTTAELILKPKK